MTIAPFDLASTYVLAHGQGRTSLVDAQEFWQSPASFDREAALVCTIGYATTWSTWEMHPDGDEIVSVIVGQFDFALELDEVRHVMVSAGETIIVPRGIWHHATVIEPGAAIHVTYGANTTVRPA